MKKLLVPLDFSGSNQNVFSYASTLARRSEAELTIFPTSAKRLLKNASHFLFQSTDAIERLKEALKDNDTCKSIIELAQELQAKKVNFRVKIDNGSLLRRIIREAESDQYDLLIVGANEPSRIRTYLRGNLFTALLKDVNVPIFIVPTQKEFNEIDHITYAVDLSDYDPNIIRQVKTIASLFDAKLTIAHVNQDTEDGHNEAYMKTLERTINDTLDYPKVYYKFFDAADILGGIKKQVKLNKSDMLAMINRKETSWKDFFADKSLTRKMMNELNVPLLAFKK